MKRSLVYLAGAAVLALAVPSFAGQKASVPVSIDKTYRYAVGALGTARNSSDGNQKIGCAVHTVAGQPAYVSCAAMDAKGRHAWCTSYDPEMVKAGQALNGDSHLMFFWNEAGSCDQIQTLNDSSTEPKQP